MMGLAAMQKPYLAGRGLIDANVKTDSVQALLKEALNSVVFIFFSSGTMSNFEKALYVDNLPENQFNAKWWELAKKYQGIVPPSARGEEYCDAATKTHINDDPAQYYDYALSYVILYQLHNHIAKNILKQDPRATNYYGQTGIGDFLKKITYPGASKDWRTVLKESTGDELNAKAMLEYFQPLVSWLKEQNKGKKYTLPESYRLQKHNTTNPASLMACQICLNTIFAPRLKKHHITMRVAVVGATGLVGSTMLQILEERNFPLTELIPVASEKSVGTKVKYKGKEYSVVNAETAISMKPQLAIFSAGGSISLELAPKLPRLVAM